MATLARFPITAAQYEALRLAGQPNGVALYDATGALLGKYIVRYGTKAEIDAEVLDPGELALTSDTHEIRQGDGVSYGGFAFAGSTASEIRVPATGTAAQNGVALRAAYALAATLTPNGAALGPGNEATVAPARGVFDLTGGSAVLALVNYVNLIGAGSYETTIVTNNTNRLQYAATTTAHTMKGLRLTSATATSMVIWTMPGTGNTVTVYHDDLWFNTNDATKNTMALTGQGTLAGTIRRVRTEGKTLYGTTSGSAYTLAATVDDCEAGDQSFGSGATLGTNGTFTGLARRLRINGTVWHINLAGRLEDCDLAAAIQKATAGAEIIDTRIRAEVSGVSVGNQGNAAALKIVDLWAVGSIGNGVTLANSATPGAGRNIVSDAQAA